MADTPYEMMIREWIKGLEFAHDRTRATLFIFEDLVTLAQSIEQQAYERLKAQLGAGDGREPASP